MAKGPKPRPLIERVTEKIRLHPSGCWEWIGCLDTKGYGTTSVPGLALRVHRVVYESCWGTIPDGFDVHHECKNRWCVNPYHLEALTRKENLLRSDTIPARNASKTHCSQGHEFSPENTYVHRGARKCRTCTREHNRETYWRRKDDPERHERRRQSLRDAYHRRKERA